MTVFCRDCFFARNKYASSEFDWRCKAPQNLSPVVNPVTGDSVEYRRCEDLRSISNSIEEVCGPEGKWFLSHQDYVKNERERSSDLGARSVSSSLKKNITVEDL